MASQQLKPAHPKYLRAKIAFSCCNCRALARVDEWLSGFDRNTLTLRILSQLLAQHLETNGKVIETDQRIDAPAEWASKRYYTVIEIGGSKQLVEWVEEPEDDENPYLVLVNAHPPDFPW